MHRTCLAMLGAAALAVAGCGGGDDERPAGEAPPTATALAKPEFIARANAICREVKGAQRPYNDRVEALARGAGLERVAPLLEGALRESRKGFDRLRDLRAQAPAEDRATFDAYLAAAERLLAESARLAEAARSGDRAAGLGVAATADALSADEQRLAGEYGIEDCADVF